MFLLKYFSRLQGFLTKICLILNFFLIKVSTQRNHLYLLSTFENLYTFSSICSEKQILIADFTQPLELVGGEGPYEGNIFVMGRPVCDTTATPENAQVVCR